MEDADVLEGIHRKFCETGDISYRESDAVFRIAQRFFSRKSYLSLKDVVPKWYEKVKREILNGRWGVFVHTVPLGSTEDFLQKSGHNRRSDKSGKLSDRNKLHFFVR